MIVIPRPDPESISFAYGIMDILERKIGENGLPKLQYRIFDDGPAEALQMQEIVPVVLIQADLNLGKSNSEWLSDFRNAFPHAKIYVLDGWLMLPREKGLDKADGVLNGQNVFELMDLMLEIVQEDIYA
ncbi:hypothetical protein A2886_01690 [candidate division WWE3 bacterium RIFCSPHIGHO2_01_FULL_42_13]|uniref:Uncharacterized protein n=1 Tax=candidate division WWE3 bacterium RIFCSPHIGHO2_01_FULL_42_13 TaxID=1802617 RepID=A0A1F4UQS4_UNCKA|nr:MAG: hypothetical protein A2886_01690 [candidate division WWE3 bacterium RIFCSPHIGHO2_01_FULL_42_13]